MPARPPRVWILLVVLLVVGAVVGGLAYASLQPRADQNADTQSCSPKPCAAPNGFEIYITHVGFHTADGGIVEMQVSFTNHTQGEAFEAVSYRHTSTEDFAVATTDGNYYRAAFMPDAPCTKWPELQVQRGRSAGPEELCFRTGSSKLKGAKLVWSPDLGLLFRDVKIPID